MSEAVEKLMKRPLPSFDEWLGEDKRGDGFEEFEDVVRRLLDAGNPLGLSEDEASLQRIWTGMAVATVELCNREYKHGRTAPQIVQMFPRALACAAMYAAASVFTEDVNYRTVAKLLVEEFRFAAKTAADGLENDRARD